MGVCRISLRNRAQIGKQEAKKVRIGFSKACLTTLLREVTVTVL